VAWNSQVPHILATCSANGSTIVWDLRQKKPWCELRDPARGLVSDIAWNPEKGLEMLTASGDDNNPWIRLWDLRTSTSVPLAVLKDHTQGVLSVSWCPHDPAFLLSAGKDNRTILWDLRDCKYAYELPSSDVAEADTAYGGFGAASQQRRFQVTWSPVVKGVIGACSFNRTLEFYSLAGGWDPDRQVPGATEVSANVLLAAVRCALGAEPGPAMAAAASGGELWVGREAGVCDEPHGGGPSRQAGGS
jgi:protein transport protein SEC31